MDQIGKPMSLRMKLRRHLWCLLTHHCIAWSVNLILLTNICWSLVEGCWSRAVYVGTGLLQEIVDALHRKEPVRLLFLTQPDTKIVALLWKSWAANPSKKMGR